MAEPGLPSWEELEWKPVLCQDSSQDQAQDDSPFPCIPGETLRFDTHTQETWTTSRAHVQADLSWETLVQPTTPFTFGCSHWWPGGSYVTWVAKRASCHHGSGTHGLLQGGILADACLQETGFGMNISVSASPFGAKKRQT